jgi:hypothetical protein
MYCVSPFYTEVTKEVPWIEPFHISLKLLCFSLQCTSLHSSPVVEPFCSSECCMWLLDTGQKGLKKHTTVEVGSLQCCHPHHSWDFFPVLVQQNWAAKWFCRGTKDRLTKVTYGEAFSEFPQFYYINMWCIYIYASCALCINSPDCAFSINIHNLFSLLFLERGCEGVPCYLGWEGVLLSKTSLNPFKTLNCIWTSHKTRRICTLLNKGHVQCGKNMDKRRKMARAVHILL